MPTGLPLSQPSHYDCASSPLPSIVGHSKRSRRRRHSPLATMSYISITVISLTATFLSMTGSIAMDLNSQKITRTQHQEWKRTGSRFINGTYHKLYTNSNFEINPEMGSPLILYTARMGIEDTILQKRERWLRQSPAISRILDEGGNNNYYNDDVDANYDDASGYAYTDDVVAYADDAAADDGATDDYQSNMAVICEDKTCTVNEQCTKFLFGFLEGTTDAKDNCEGIMNAYVAADCGTIKSSRNQKEATTFYDDDDMNDDYFGTFYDHQCCSSLRSHYYEYCDSDGILNEYNLLVVAAVMLLCECAKSIVKKYRIRFLPEAAACMLVGMAFALITRFFGTNIELLAFDEEIFMYLLLPPIIFEAALSVNKREFRRRRGAIMVFAVFGTLLSSFMTGTITYYSAKYSSDDVDMPILDALVFGSLISSIDPVAILSVLTSLKMTETDTIYILVLGESLLNDGIAITLFKSLVEHYSANAAISFDDILGSIADFLIIACGSCTIGLVCGVACLCYFHLNSSILHPVMEVASFFLWAVVPYWMSEAFEWSGIVAIVVMGFFMDIYLRPGWDPAELEREEQMRQLMVNASDEVPQKRNPHTPVQFGYYNMEDDDSVNGKFRFRGTAVDIPNPRPEPLQGRDSSIVSKSNKPQAPPLDDDCDKSTSGTSTRSTPNVKAILMKKESVRMSREADEHVRFVAHILSQMSENAIFAYLGLFLFSSKYEWDAILCSIGVTSCILSRAVMVVSASWFIWYLHVFRQRAGCHSEKVSACVADDMKSDSNGSEGDFDTETKPIDPLNTPVSKSARALSNPKVQVVLILAGLRGAVSLALVESVPIYNGVTGVGTKNKPLLKAMTSSSIIFTIFFLGGGAYYILKWLDITSEDMLIKSTGRSRRTPYTYPQLYCGATPEMELSSTGSFQHNENLVSSGRHRPLFPLQNAAYDGQYNSTGMTSLLDRQDSRDGAESMATEIVTIPRKSPDPDAGLRSVALV
mmetsp:Transcript_8014/g.16368  ORF Transcript_8014/g.16368 Transcript_8014/m.16368 type:complete len:987 (+) Transcript_8014:179-3139(+)